MVGSKVGPAFQPLKGPLVVEIRVHPPDRRKRDIDNLAKALLEALQHASVYRDDSQIIRVVMEKRYPIQGGISFVRIDSLS